MVRYEVLILTVPEITTDEAASLETDVVKLVEKGKGALRSFERWGKYKLSYPVRNNDYGVYFLARFELDLKNVKEVLDNLKSLFSVAYSRLVMRHIITRLDINKSLAYLKPDSLEDIPSQDVDTFLRENNMEGLLKGGSQEVGSKSAEAGMRKEVTSQA